MGATLGGVTYMWICGKSQPVGEEMKHYDVKLENYGGCSSLGFEVYFLCFYFYFFDIFLVGHGLF